MCISRHSPYGSSLAREALDATLAASVFDQDIALLFMDDGVLQLLKHQDSQNISQKNISKSLGALNLYGVENIYVHQASLNQRNLNKTQLTLENVRLLDDQATQQLMAEYDQLLSF